jgi:nucleotide-binding universal stress UspA family protein
MKTIILATDFSNTATNAANYAVKLAEKLHTDILLVNVFEILPNYGEVLIDVNVENLTKDANTDLQALKVELIRNTKTLVNIKTEVRLGIFFNELATLCDELKPYAVVFGSQGKTATERFFFGGHVLHAMRELNWPIIAVPPKAYFKEIYKIGLAYDFKVAIDETIITQVLRTANDFNAEIHVLNAEKEAEFNADYVTMSGKLERSLKPFQLKYHFLASNDTDESVINFVDKNYINLLIIMPKHHSIIDKLLHKSHSKELILHSHVPILSLSK